MMTIRIPIPMFEVGDTVGRMIAGLKSQTHTDFECWLVDDLSSDNTYDAAVAAVAEDPRFHVIRNTEKRFALGNIAWAIQQMNPDDEDVIVLLDGDDYLDGDEVLSYVADEYTDSECWLTYGSYRCERDGDTATNGAYADTVVATNRFRQAEWRASHLRTFRFKLWNAIEDDAFRVTQEDIRAVSRAVLKKGRVRTWLQWRHLQPDALLDPSGRFVRRCFDKAIMLPMLELAGTHSRHLEKVLYVYTGSPPHAQGLSSRCSRWLTRCIRTIIQNRTPYAPLDDGRPS